MSFTFRWVPTPGQNNSFVNQSVNGGGRARAIRDDGQLDPFDSPLYICIPPITFLGGDAGAATLYDFARLIATCGPTTTITNPGIDYRGNRIPTGGALTINGNACGTYEFNVIPSGTQLTQATVASLFSNNNDISTWIVCKGNLVIPNFVVLKPNVNPAYNIPSTNTSPDPDALRRLFMVVYVTGTLTFAGVNASISMSACGANTSAQGANIASFNLPIANNLNYFDGTFTVSSSPAIQVSGGVGATGVNNANGETGGTGLGSVDGSQLYTGGGGSGNQLSGDVFSGGGGNGSPFSGGAGGGSSREIDGATNGSSLGGAGGIGAPAGEDGGTVGGTGNPGGSGSSFSGDTGTGGVLIVICEGSVGSTGSLRANGVDNVSNGADQGGGASGGGIVAVIQSSSTANAPTREAIGGVGTYGGSGGAGTVFKYGINS